MGEEAGLGSGKTHKIKNRCESEKKIKKIEGQIGGGGRGEEAMGRAN